MVKLKERNGNHTRREKLHRLLIQSQLHILKFGRSIKLSLCQSSFPTALESYLGGSKPRIPTKIQL